MFSRNQALNLIGAIDRFAVYTQNDILGFQSRGIRRCVGKNIGDEYAAGAVQAERIGQGGVDRFEGYAEKTPADPSIGDDIIHYLSCQVDRNGEAVPDKPPILRCDRRVHADDFALEINQSAAGVAGVDGGVGLDEVFHAERVRYDIQVAAQGADNSGGDGGTQAERRADRHHPLSDSDLVGVAHRRGGEVFGVDLDDRHVRKRIRADQPGFELLVVIEDDCNLVRSAHDVVVGQYISVRGHDNAGAESRTFLFPVPGPPEIGTKVKPGVHFLARHRNGLPRADRDHGGRNPPGNARKGFVEVLKLLNGLVLGSDCGRRKGAGGEEQAHEKRQPLAADCLNRHREKPFLLFSGWLDNSKMDYPGLRVLDPEGRGKVPENRRDVRGKTG